MEVLGNAANRMTSYLMTMTVSDYVDIILIAYIIYRVIMFIRKTNARYIAIGALIFMVVLWLSEVTNLTMVNTLMRKAVELGLIALLILFQPELRRMLERVGSSITDGRFTQGTVIESTIDETVSACSDMSCSHTGALIVFARNVSINHVLSTGTLVNSDTTAELIKNIFFDKAPLHDGALVVKNCRIAAAGCMLPLTQNKNLSKELGTRHRAGIGMSEQSDAVIVIVSEETGAISVAIDGNLKRHLSEDELRAVLRKELVVDEEEESRYSSMVKFVKKHIMLDDGREDRKQ